MEELFKKYGILLTGEQLSQMNTYKQMLIEKNRVMDLTNVPQDEMDERHFLDSLLPFFAMQLGQIHSFADVGTGAGFPGLPLAIAFPSMKVTLIDAQEKRCQFLREVKEALHLDQVSIIHYRAEDAGKDKALRESFDIAAARAVAPLNVLQEYLLPLVKLGGKALCWKGPGVTEELNAARKAAFLLGGKLGEMVRMPIDSAQHYIVPTLKISKTPGCYPRKSGTPNKKPLGV